MAAVNRNPLYLLTAAIHAYDAVHRLNRCVTCGASWERHEGDECRWCAEALENMRRWQAETVLQPPDIDRDDITYDDVMRGWAERLANAVTAELIPRTKAEAAWKRATT